MARLLILTGERYPGGQDFPGIPTLIDGVRGLFPRTNVFYAELCARDGGLVFSNDPFFLYKINNLVQKHLAGDPDGLDPRRVAMMRWDEKRQKYISLKSPDTKLFNLGHIDGLLDELGQEFSDALDRAFGSGKERKSCKTGNLAWGQWHRVKSGELQPKPRTIHTIRPRWMEDSQSMRFIRERCLMLPGSSVSFDDLHAELREWRTGRRREEWFSFSMLDNQVPMWLGLEVVSLGVHKRGIKGLCLKRSLSYPGAKVAEPQNHPCLATEPNLVGEFLDECCVACPFGMEDRWDYIHRAFSRWWTEKKGLSAKTVFTLRSFVAQARNSRVSGIIRLREEFRAGGAA